MEGSGVGVGTYDGGRFAPELEHDGLEVLRRLDGDDTPDMVAARELTKRMSPIAHT